MFYTDENGSKVELASFTKALGAKQDAYIKAATADPPDPTVSVKQYEFVKSAIVDLNYLKKRIGGTSLDIINYCEVAVMYIEIDNAYQMYVIRAKIRAEKLRNELISGASTRGFDNVK